MRQYSRADMPATIAKFAAYAFGSTAPSIEVRRFSAR